MPKPVLIDQVHLSFFVPNDATSEVADAATAVLDRQEFLDAVQVAVRSVLDTDPALTMLTVIAHW